VEGLPFSIDWLPDGRLVTTTPAGVVAGPHLEPYGAIGQPFNEIVVDAAGRAWVDMPGSMPWEEPKPRIVAVVLPDGTSRQVADDVRFPKGMIVLGEDTLVVAESHADRLTTWTITDSDELVDRRVWADLGPGSAPDGICADAEGAIWYASVPDSAARASPKAARCWTPSTPTAVASHACSAAKTAARSNIVANRYTGGSASDGIVLTQPVAVPHAGRP
jgi:sugar lactone lactonase YvrE